MPAKGSCCTACEPCEAELASCDGSVCLQCAPRRLCATVTVMPPPGIKTCCPGNVFSFTMPMTCNGRNVSWTGGGTCGLIDAAATITLTDNDSSGGCEARLEYVADGVLVDQIIAFTGFPITLETTIGNNAHSVVIGAAASIPHPWNKAACNPCICTRCLPPAFCVAIHKGSSVPDKMDCDPCQDLTTLAMNACDYTGTVELKCGVDTYTVTASLPPIENGQCGIRFQISGPGVSIDVVLGGESAGGSTNGCYKCCRPGQALPMSRIGRCRDVSCSDCFAEDPAEDNGCGVVTLGEVNYSDSVVIEEVGIPENEWKTFRVSIREQWCGERCSNDLIDQPQCCFRLQGPIAGAEQCLDNPSQLTMSFIAPACQGLSPDADSGGLTLGTLDASGCADGSIFQSGWVGTGIPFHACPALATVTAILFCNFPSDCKPELEPGEYCEFARLYLYTEGNSLGGHTECLTPVRCTCDPLFFEFEMPIPGLVGADPEGCPDWCDESGTLTIRITE